MRIETKCIQSGYKPGKWRAESSADLSKHNV